MVIITIEQFCRQQYGRHREYKCQRGTSANKEVFSSQLKVGKEPRQPRHQVPNVSAAAKNAQVASAVCVRIYIYITGTVESQLYF